MFSGGVTAERSFSAGGPQPPTAAAAPVAATILKKLRRSIGFIDASYPCASPSTRRKTQSHSIRRHRSDPSSLPSHHPKSYESRLVSCLAKRQTVHRGGTSTNNTTSFRAAAL